MAPNAASVPRILYGTAWKEDRTEALVRAALDAGFRGFDTANQRKHYHEAGVGAALRDALASGRVAREELFVQTKFTFARGQDHRLPYDPRAPVAEQVAQSFESSVEHLGVDVVDSLVLHGPTSGVGLADADREAWRAMEALHRAGRVRALGVSNVSAAQLEALHGMADVKPAFVQSRTLAWPAADHATRAFCRENAIVYQGFSLLTAAPRLLAHPAVAALAARASLPEGAALLRLWIAHGMVALTGTSSPAHMASDLAALDVEVLPEERAAFARTIPLA